MSSSWIRQDKRQAIYLRDGYACVFCGAAVDDPGTTLTLDHLQARNLGGGNEATNLVTCCLSCNSSKQDLPMREWMRVLADRGVDVTELPKKIRRHTRRVLNLKLARKVLADRN
jgi:5-methylcytosine-specific restriction endonuclease McrA